MRSELGGRIETRGLESGSVYVLKGGSRKGRGWSVACITRYADEETTGWHARLDGFLTYEIM